jgi:hypothetical protein
LGIAGQKMSLLTASGALASNAVLTSQMTGLAEKATALYVKILESEVHEATILHVLENLQMWLGNL